MRGWQLNNLNNFIAGWYIEDQSLLDRLLVYARTNSDRGPAQTRSGSVDPRVKNSQDSRLDLDLSLYSQYKSQLQLVLNHYMQRYPWSNSYSAFGLEYPVICQDYPPGGGFLQWHTERVAGGSSRHLVFMTYLTDCNDGEGGHTEFLHQEISVQPEKGLTIIWPTDWTHTHRGLPATVAKTVVTGWFKFLR